MSHLHFLSKNGYMTQPHPVMLFIWCSKKLKLREERYFLSADRLVDVSPQFVRSHGSKCTEHDLEVLKSEPFQERQG